MAKSNKKLKVHFIGVGGAGMSVLARLLLSKNFIVSGSDAVKSHTVENLISNGLIFYDTQTEKNVLDKDVVVYSSAIPKSNLELIKAKELNKAVYGRAELLDIVLKSYGKSIGISGSHGKTTTSCMLANVLIYSGVNITALLGGEDINLGSFIYSNSNYVIVSEICEYDKNIKRVSPTLAVCLNVDNDHLDCYGNIENLKNEFFSYLTRAKVKIINKDDKFLCGYSGEKVITYAVDSLADYTAKNLTEYNGKYAFDLYYKDKFINKVFLNVYGKHNLSNALAVIAVCHYYFNLDFNVIIKGVEKFKGVKRRFEELKTKTGTNIILDYAHHPSEIEKALITAKERFNGDFITVFQPHTYSRTKLLLSDFIKVLNGYNLIIFKEYPARESYDYFGCAKLLSEKIKNSVYIDDFMELLTRIKSLENKNVLILGAGDLYDKIKNADI